MNKNIKALFKSIIFNCELKELVNNTMYFKVGDESVGISVSKHLDEKEKCNTTPLSIGEIVTGNYCLWNFSAPKEFSELPIYDYTLITDFRNYYINDLTLTEQEQIAEYINKILKEYEEKRLETLINNALK